MLCLSFSPFSILISLCDDKTLTSSEQDDVISKPFRIPDLLPKIEELVGKYKTLAISDSSTT